MAVHSPVPAFGQADYSTPYAFTTLAGQASLGSADGTGSAARFNHPNGVAVDSTGNVYVADEWNNTIRKVTPAGVVTTLAGSAGSSGSADGTGSAARFNWPSGVAVDNAGNVYVADTSNHTIRKVTPAGVVTTLAGSAFSWGSTDGIGTAAQFYYPSGVAVDSAGNVYVADSIMSTIRKVTSAGVVTTLAGLAGSSGSADGTGSAARFNWPSGVAVDNAGNVYVADSNNRTIRKMTPAGAVTTLAGLAGSWGSTDGTGNAARFGFASGVAVDNAGYVYVADSNTIRKVTPTGVVTTQAGSAFNRGSTDGTGSAVRFNTPRGVAVDSAGNLYVADTDNNTIRKLTSSGVVTTLAGLTGAYGSLDGTGSAARFDHPSGVAVDSAGNVFVADSSNHTIRKVTPAGVVTTLAGLAGSWGSADGTGSAARFSAPQGVAVDSAGYVYVADWGNATIRKVTPAGVVTTLAGLAGQHGSADGTGSTARFYGPLGAAADAAGNVYAADSNNHTLRKVTPAGVVTTLAGLAGSAGSADGTGSAARFNYPSSVAVDSAGNVYVADYLNETVRRVTPAGVVTTLAGLAGTGGRADGVGSAARFSGLQDVAVDSAGNVYAADEGTSTIRKVTPAGVVTTLAGADQGSADGTGSAARFYWPWGVAVDSAGNLYVADTQNNTIRKGWPASGGEGVMITSQPQSQTAPAGADVTLSVTAGGTGQLFYQWRKNGADLPGQTDATLSLNSVNPSDSGGYSVVVRNAYGSAVSATAYLAVYLPPPTPPPPAPVTVQTSRPHTSEEVGSGTIPSNPHLRVFAKGSFQGNTPVLPDRMTIVLTHGWKGDPNDPNGWAITMAAGILSKFPSSPPNLVAWDWSEEAQSAEPFSPAIKTRGQGLALGAALLQALGPDYTHSIHFIGHSLGTLVNSAAADYLHGDMAGATPPKGPGAFLPANTHMTLFDEAELAPETVNTVLSVVLSRIGAGPAPVRPFYDRPLPEQKAWADNYISAFGLFHDDAVNVVLTDGLGEVAAARDFSALWSALGSFHSYPMKWYDQTVTNPNPLASPMGYRWSFEEAGLGDAPPPDQVFVQSSSGAELDLARGDRFTEESNYAKRLGTFAKGLGYTLVETVKDGLAAVYGSVTTSIHETVARDPYAMTAGVGGLVARWSTDFTLQTGPGAPGPLRLQGGRQPQNGAGNTPAYLWATVSVPSDALYMSFDFKIEGNGSNDLFAAAVNGTNVLSLETSLVATNVLANSGLIDIAPWAGQAAELFFGIVGGTSTNASVTVQAIRFYQPVPPSLSAWSDGTNIVVSWPLWTVGMQLQSADRLGGTNSWSAVTNQTATVNFMNTVTNPVFATQRYFRLGPAP